LSFFGCSEVLFCFVLLSRASTRSGLFELLLVCILAPLGASSVSFVGFGVQFNWSLKFGYKTPKISGLFVLRGSVLGSAES
jgi:hypothetical protein